MSLLIMACTEQKNESSLSSDDRNVLPEEFVIDDYRLTPKNINMYAARVLNNMGRVTRASDIKDAPNQVDISNPHKASKTTTPYHFTYQIGIYANIYPIK